jgi:hypothetical protein
VPPSAQDPDAQAGPDARSRSINKFTKWPEVTLVVKINKQFVVKFIKSIVCRFRVPNRITTDDGTQFNNRLFQEYYKDLGV